MTIYCIGDVQGCYAELNALLEKIHFNPAQDFLWFTGDLVNRGPESLAVLRLVNSLKDRALMVLGNHDLHLLAVVSGAAPIKKHDTLDEILNAPDCDELCDWLRQQPLLHHDAQLDYTVVHAGLPPQWDLATAQARATEVQKILRSDRYTELFTHMYSNHPERWEDTLTGWDRLRVIINYFTRLRFCDANGTMELITKGKAHAPPPNFHPWFKLPNRANKNLRIIFGHWAALEGHADAPNVYALDTGCVWGKCLTAMRLTDGARLNVPCSERMKIGHTG